MATYSSPHDSPRDSPRDSSHDPPFFLHHAFVDKQLWYDWQVTTLCNSNMPVSSIDAAHGALPDLRRNGIMVYRPPRKTVNMRQRTVRKRIVS
ncbi:hypothetical protein PTSG_11927 [Salpingoeca rosetta]|uniref:Tyrosinase copper-binding domain-containing protein n=1 Tax=Salpingoeca rosetta (strain ATCC 50818 / BSB-021) TaxID=946362 RepID=F2U3G2_SALR5|nr:uncharacterized protein PTSG_11927 [Salpingoeca rosetta]EGD82156.1 hypothetical protein PTSG_11927 [Salpingoeca rosetta]|eukprot:XP_004996339.1 hypothetical protein PTSG_11927 [Salpingoeca rosetta]